MILSEILNNIFLLIIVILFTVSLLVQLYYYLFVFIRITKKPKIISDNKLVPVSVVICAQNEEINLMKFLPSVLEQNYPNYEVIVVDDCSTDATADVLAGFKNRYQHLKVTFINKDDRFTHGKKLALTVGIKAASNEWLLLTDADCKPVSKNWIRSMAVNFTDDKELILGYGGFFRMKSILNNMIRFDNLFIAIQYLSFAMRGKPYMGVGRNMAYRKSLFFKNKGFSRHYHILSGDDDIFVNEVATKKNTAVEYSKDSIVLSTPQTTFMNWFMQKRRHFTTSKFYTFKSKIALSLELFSRLLFYYSFIILVVLLTKEPLWLVLSMFASRLLVMLIIYKYAINRLNQKNLLLPSLVYDFVLPYFNLVFYTANLFSRKKNTWK